MLLRPPFFPALCVGTLLPAQKGRKEIGKEWENERVGGEEGGNRSHAIFFLLSLLTLAISVQYCLPVIMGCMPRKGFSDGRLANKNLFQPS